jgi:plasmid stabilization system protein ParE
MPDAYQVRISLKATVDLDAIHAHISKDFPQNADRLIVRLFAAFEGLRQHPFRTVYQTRSRRLSGPVRSLTEGSYVIYFHVSKQRRVVDVLTVRHGAHERRDGSRHADATGGPELFMSVHSPYSRYTHQVNCPLPPSCFTVFRLLASPVDAVQRALEKSPVAALLIGLLRLAADAFFGNAKSRRRIGF